MKVAILTTGFPRSAGDLFGNFVLELARHLKGLGVSVQVLAPHDPGIPLREFLQGVDVKRFRYMLPVSLQSLAYGGGIPTNLRTSWWARLQVPLFLIGFCVAAMGVVRRSEIVHCQWTASGLVGWVATRIWRRPVVLTVRGSDFHMMSKGLGAKLNRFVLARMDLLLAVSQDIEERLIASGISRTKVALVENGVDAKFCPADRDEARSVLNLRTDAVLILFVGLLVQVKGLNDLLQAMHLLGDGYQCVLVGDGQERAPLEAHAKELGLESRVTFVGSKPSCQMPLWMASADIVVLPSHSEGRPNVVLEAMASGRCVVATEVGGTPELVRHQETGLLVPPMEPEQLAGALRLAGVDKRLRDRLGAAAVTSISERKLTWQASAMRTKELYASRLLARGAS